MIASAGYDKVKKLLEIEFNSGHVWHYYKVPEKYFTALVNAKSVGHYFDNFIKDEYVEVRVK